MQHSSIAERVQQACRTSDCALGLHVQQLSHAHHGGQGMIM